MFSLLKKWLAPPSPTDADPALERDPRVADFNERDAVNGLSSALASFVKRVLAPVGEMEAERAAHILAEALAGRESPTDCLAWGLLDMQQDDAKADWALVIYTDWKAVEEVAWQADAVLMTLGIAERWAIPAAEQDHTVPHLLLSFSAWLRPHGYQLLYVDTGGDNYYALPIRSDAVDEAMQLADAARLDIRRDEVFRAHELGQAVGTGCASVL